MGQSNDDILSSGIIPISLKGSYHDGVNERGHYAITDEQTRWPAIFEVRSCTQKQTSALGAY